MRVDKDSTDVTTYLKLVDPSTGDEETGLVISDLIMTYIRDRKAPSSIAASSLTTISDSHADNKMFEADSTNAPGLYRADWPDAAFSDEINVDKVQLVIKGTAVDTAVLETWLDTIVTPAAIQTIDDEIATIDTVVDTISATQVTTLANIATVDTEVGTIDTVVDLISASIGGLNDITTASVTGGVTVSEAQTHGDTNWITATGFSTHTPSDVHEAFSINSIYVNSDVGNDSNNGLTWDTAKATVSNACDTASNGFVINIGPGIYDEAINLDVANKSLMLQGTGAGKTIITTDGSRTLELHDDCTIRDLSVINTHATGIAVRASAKSDLQLERIYAEGGFDGIYFTTCDRIVIDDCVSLSGYDAINLLNSIFILKNSHFVTDAGYENQPTDAVRTTGTGIIRDCILTALRADASGQNTYALYVSGGGRVTVENCVLDAEVTNVDCTGRVIGATCVGGVVLLNGCNVTTANVGSGDTHDLRQTAGLLQVTETGYDTAKIDGTITHIPPQNYLDENITTVSAAIQTVDDELAVVDTAVDLVSASIQTVDDEIETIDTVVDLVSASVQVVSGAIVDLSDITITDVTDAVWDEMVSDHRTSGTMGERMSDVITLGPGATSKTYTIKDGDGNPIEGVTVWVTTDFAGTNTIANDITNSSGEVTFNLDSGITYYIWSRKDGYNFSNPDTEIV